MFQEKDPFFLEEVPEAELQMLAVVSAEASKELGRRKILLTFPRLQDRKAWVRGYEETVSVHPDSLRAVQACTESSDPVYLYLVKQKYEYTDIDNPSDPFGPKIRALKLKPEIFRKDGYESEPSYEDVVNYLFTL